jgi:3-isopropylmalate dehydrogenase
MLDHLGLHPQAGAVRRAVRASVRARQTTQDIGGSLGTREAGDWLAEYVTKQGA